MNTVPLFLRLAPLALLAGIAQAGVSAPDRVGEATLVIGVVRVIAADGQIRVVDRGAAIREGDRIETGEGGHVHLRFVDGGRLSVRPSSRLQIENYSRSGEQTPLTAIRFRLDEGVVRSITGAWGEAERDRFRLNTPVAAIGVKGTDFVVKSDANNTFASVYTGAIMLTPLATSGCQASLGPCLNGSEKLLSEDMKGQMLALSRQQASPQLVPAVDLLAAQRLRSAPLEVAPRQDYALKSENNRPDTTVEKVVVSEARAADAVVSQASTAAQQVQAVTPAPAPVVTPVVPSVPVVTQPVVPVVVPPVTVVVDVPVAPLAPVLPVAPVIPVLLPPVVNQLVWARVAAVAVDGDTLSRSFATAMENGRQGTVGNFGFSLFRAGPDLATAVLSSADSSANFRLAGAAAQLVWSDRGLDVTEAARVDSGTLSVDFARSTYATQVNVSSARIGTDAVVSNGVIKANGVLQSQAGNAFLAGALSLDGKEAGYFFDKSLAAGQLSGITLWGR
jgi:hypothetical protein